MTSVKPREQKLRELEFWFKSYRKKEKQFRDDSVYRAILEAIKRHRYESFLSYDIEKDIRKYHPEVVKDLKRDIDADFVVGRAIGSRLKQMTERSMLKVLEDIPEISRQKTFAVDEDVKERFKEYVEELLIEITKTKVNM